MGRPALKPAGFEREPEPIIWEVDSMKKHGQAVLAVVLMLVSLLALAGCGGGGGSKNNGGGSWKVLFASTRNAASSSGSNIFAMNLDGTGVTALTALTDGTWNSQPEYSPDYARIAYVKQTATYETELWVMNADGTGGVRIYTSGGGYLYPAWTRDGRIIFFEGESGGAALYVMDAAGDNKTRITGVTGAEFSYSAGSPRIAPNGAQIAYADGESLYVADFSGGAPTVSNPTAIYTGRSPSQPSWSPDGGTIVFSEQSSDGDSYHRDIYRISASGGTAQPLTSNGSVAGYAYARYPQFSPDGAKIIFEEYSETNRGDIFSIRADGGGRTNLTDHPAADMYWLAPAG